MFEYFKNKKIIIVLFFLIIMVIVFLINFDFSKKEYIITFNTNGGNYIEPVKVLKKHKLYKPSDPTKNGFVFVGWKCGEKFYNFDEKIESDLTLNAVWQEETKIEINIVTFDSQGGTTVEPIKVKKGEIIGYPLESKKKGYKFVGWYLNKEIFDFSLPITSDVVLTAHWKKLETNSNNSNIISPNNDKVNEDSPKYEYVYDAFINYKCSYETYSIDTNNATCTDTKTIPASYNYQCLEEYQKTSDGKCIKIIEKNASARKICINGAVLKNNVCYIPEIANTTPISQCPENYSYRKNGWGLEKGYCYNYDTLETTDASFTCDGIKSLENPKLIVTDSEAYCEGKQYLLDGEGKYTSREYYCSNEYDYILDLQNKKCTATIIKNQEKVYYCPNGYNLSAQTCSPDPTIRKQKYVVEYYCPGEGINGRIMKNNKCYDKIN